MALIYHNNNNVRKLQIGGYHLYKNTYLPSGPLDNTPKEIPKDYFSMGPPAVSQDIEGLPIIDDVIKPLGPNEQGLATARSSELNDLFTILRGNDPDEYVDFLKLLGTVSYAETRRKNIRASISKKTGKPLSSAKGYFQLTNDAFTTDKQRIRNTIKKYKLNKKSFETILNAKDIRELSAEDQAKLALVHMHYSTKIPLTNYLKGISTIQDVYKGWVGDSFGKVYKNNEHIKNLNNKISEIEKDNLNSLDYIVPFLFRSPGTEFKNLSEKDQIDTSEWTLRKEKAIKAQAGGTVYNGVPRHIKRDSSPDKSKDLKKAVKRKSKEIKKDILIRTKKSSGNKLVKSKKKTFYKEFKH